MKKEVVDAYAYIIDNLERQIKDLTMLIEMGSSDTIEGNSYALQKRHKEAQLILIRFEAEEHGF